VGDVLGVVLLVMVHGAGVPGDTGGKVLLVKLFMRIKRSSYNCWRRLKLIWTDGAYEGIVSGASKSVGRR
jgi:hypothetical protein